jgi:NAD(P)-dependent dehydrogenase (short-subunit alcohol dehydrogenase family)
LSTENESNVSRRDLAEQEVLIVGGSSGIGLATARLLSGRGAKIAIAGRSAERLEDAAAQFSVPPRTIVVDIENANSIGGLAAELDHLDHLILPGSSAAVGNFLDVPVPKAHRFFESKFWGPYRVLRAVHPKLHAAGTVTFFSGAAAERASPGFAFGSAINAAIEALTASLAVELVPIRVNAVSPGVIDTPVWSELLGDEDRQALFSDLEARLPIGRIGRPTDVARAVEFLLTNEYITGVVLRVDGGFVHV